MCVLTSLQIIIVGSDWVNLKDPTIVAETELLNAAAAIEAAAKKLEELRPRPEMVILHFSLECINV